MSDECGHWQVSIYGGAEHHRCDACELVFVPETALAAEREAHEATRRQLEETRNPEGLKRRANLQREVDVLKEQLAAERERAEKAERMCLDEFWRGAQHFHDEVVAQRDAARRWARAWKRAAHCRRWNDNDATRAMTAEFQRAEKAEAKVREYEDHPPGIGDADIQRVFRQRDAARDALRTARECIAFFASAIRSGESWTDVCEDVKRTALARIDAVVGGKP